MAKTKGTALVALKSFVSERFGQKGWSQLINSLTSADRVQVELPVSISWYDMGLLHRALNALVNVVGNGDKTLAEDFGRFEAERDLTKIYRIFLSMANPAYIIEKAGQYWRRFCDWGEWIIERNGRNGATATLIGCPVKNELYCAELHGYLARMLELVGAKEVLVQHTLCRARGDESCVWVGSWKT